MLIIYNRRNGSEKTKKKKTKQKIERGGMRKSMKTCSSKRGRCNTARENGDIEEREIILMNYL